MEALLGLLFPAIFAGIVAAVVIAVQRANKRKKEKAHRLAAQYGFLVDVERKDPPPQRFDLFDVGSSKAVTLQFWRPGSQHSVFEYEYSTGSGDNRTTHRRTCALISVPFEAPHTKIGPEGFWSGIGRKLGVRDIEVESPQFNELYKIESDDDRFAVTMLDGPTIDWLLDNSGHMTSKIRLEFWGPWMLCITNRLDMELMFGYLDWAESIPSHLPDVLTSLYPTR